VRTLARLLASRRVAWAVVAGVAALSLAATFLAARLEQDDDILAFLPAGSPEVATFHDVNRRFGGLDVAIVGLETDDVFRREFLDRLAGATRRLNATEGVAAALSLTTAESTAADPAGGVRIDYLVGELPATAEAERALRERVLVRDEIVGNLVDRDGTATVIYVFAAAGADPRAIARRVRTVVAEELPGVTTHWGGAPFIATYIYDLTQRDLRRLAPWAVLVKVAITALSFRHLSGTALALISPALGILWALGLMVVAGVRSNIVLGSLPVILFALGSAYTMHFLSRYYRLARQHEPEVAVERALLEVGPTIVATGLATAAGLLSFVVMDIVPLRTFGIFTGIGLLATLGLGLVFVPAVCVVTRMRARPAAPSDGSQALVALTAWAARRRRAVAAGLVVLAAVCVPLALSVDTRMDESAFFAPDSPPARAEEFLRRRFGGSAFVQVELAGDMTDPLALRAVAELGDRIAALPGVGGVQHVGDVLALTVEALSGERALPDTAAKAQLAYGFLEGKRAVRQLVSDARDRALIQVKLRSPRPDEAGPALAAIRALAAAPRRVVAREAVAARIAALLGRGGAPVPGDLAARLAAPRPAPPAERVAASLAAFLASDEFLGELPDEPGAAARIAAVAAAGGPLPEALAADVAGPLAQAVRREGARAHARALGLALPPGPRGERLLSGVADALLELDGHLAGEVVLPARVTGQPVLHEALSRSVARNQVLSLLLALSLVAAISALLHRSVASGLLSLAPALVAIAVIYAAMRVAGIRLDLGTSVLASLIVGAGVDYAFHFKAAWRGDTAAAAARRAAGVTAQGIWTNALVVAAGFAVLTIGEARPLRNVGALTAVAMLVAALATFVVIPALARRRLVR
jgi:predicted RND superfamily exporter protein